MNSSEPHTALRVCSFESRRCDEMSALIRRFGADATVAPSMQEIPLDDNAAVFAFAERLLAGQFDAVIFLTGVGARSMLEIAELRHDRESLLVALRKTTIMIRGPKPAAVMREWDVIVTIRAPEPNTWEDLVRAIDESECSLAGSHVAIQEYGLPSEELYAALRQRGAVVTAVPVYRWALPDDTAPLEAAVEATVNGGFDLLLFTSAQQARHVLQVAESQGLLEPFREALTGLMIASIGPTCSDALRDEELPVDLEPSHPKMGTLVREAIAAAPALLDARRSS